MHEMHESGEMYLETIYVLNKKSPEVRSVDVAEYMGFSKPSVSFLELTDAGTEVAKKIYERHTVLTEMLVKMGVSEETAAQDACKIEHVISDETLGCIKKTLGK